MAENHHVYPVNDLTEHDTDSAGECICGPDAELVKTQQGDAWLYVHHSLDGREKTE